MPVKKKISNKFITISKVEDDKFVKYRTSNLVKFYRYITERFPDYRWTNVYVNRGKDKGKQIGSITKDSPPLSKDKASIRPN